MSTQLSAESQGQYVRANGLTIYYEEHSSGSPLILLHGGSLTSKMWQPLLPALTQHFQVFALDCRGHGRTDNPTSELSYRSMADDIAAFIHALGLTQPLVWGFSVGAVIALELGIHHPTLARALVLSGVYYQFSESYFTFFRDIGFEGPGVLNLDQAQRNAPDLVAFWQEEHLRADDPHYWQTLTKQLSVLWWKPLEYTQADFEQITAPTLILMGDRDLLMPVEHAVTMYRWILNSELAIVPNGEHGAVLVDTIVQSIVLDFLKRHSFNGIRSNGN